MLNLSVEDIRYYQKRIKQFTKDRNLSELVAKMQELLARDQCEKEEKESMTTHTDCDLNCPRMVFSNTAYCCKNCHESRKEFYGKAPDDVKAFWEPKMGFWTPDLGCKLPREKRPPECLTYDCRNQVFVMAMLRQGDKWPLTVQELPRSEANEEAFMEKAREVYSQMTGRGFLEHDEPSALDEAMKHIDGPTVYVLHGMIGSGKSSWAKKFCARHSRARIVSADSFRSMLHGKYEYHVEMDDIITSSMRDSIAALIRGGYDAIVDCGNLTRDRRKPWREIGATKKVAVRFPKMHKDWHVRRRVADPHWQVDWGKIYDGELAAIEPLDEGWDAIIDVPVWEVSGRKILILTASPVRDKHIDNLIATKLRALGHEVEVSPCQRGGRERVLDFKPNIVLVPPIRNPNSRDFANDLKRFGCAVVVRHTEPSCSWQDWKKMSDQQKMEILGAFTYAADIELVWSNDEADILNRRKCSHKSVGVGAIGLDIYFDETLKKTFPTKGEFCKKYHFDAEKPTLLITSPWGFADSAPDLNIDDMSAANLEQEGFKAHVAMTREVVAALKDKWNILLSIHHGVDPRPYMELAQELKVPLDNTSPMLDMLPSCSAIIHAGSTAALSAHLLNVPAFQFGDVNAKGVGNWWGIGESAISRVSPRFEKAAHLIAAIQPGGSNAKLETIKELEEGRYGTIDGKATERAVKYITQLGGKFRYCWPRGSQDYRQLTVQRDLVDFVQRATCGVCHESFWTFKEEYVQMMAKTMNVDVERLRPKFGVACPFCAARFYKAE
jgi:hypothetical protein